MRQYFSVASRRARGHPLPVLLIRAQCPAKPPLHPALALTPCLLSHGYPDRGIKSHAQVAAFDDFILELLERKEKMVYLFLADGFEETEAFVPYDILKRGGIDVVKVGVTGEYVTGSHGITVKTDALIDDIDESCDMAILPGGMPGTENLDKCDKVKAVVRKAFIEGKYVAAICAAPMVLGKLGILNGKMATCFPGFEEYLFGAEHVHSFCVRSGNVVTACGAGAAFQFGFTLLSLFDKEKSEEVKRSMQYVL